MTAAVVIVLAAVAGTALAVWRLSPPCADCGARWQAGGVGRYRARPAVQRRARLRPAGRLAMADETGRIEVRYAVPLGEDEGHVELHITCPVSISETSRAFVRDVLALVTGFAEVVVPSASPDPGRLVGLARSWEAEAAEIDVPDDPAVRAAADGLRGCATDLRRILADARWGTIGRMLQAATGPHEGTDHG